MALRSKLNCLIVSQVEICAICALGINEKKQSLALILKKQQTAGVLYMKALLLAVISSALCLSCSAPALAQCAANDHVYIDLRLVPHRPQISEDHMQGILA